MANQPAVRIRGLRKSYGGRPVLDGVDLEARAGQVLAVLGPNGAGKTTAVRILSTLVAPDGGTATVAGYDVVREPAKVRAAISLTGQYAAVDELLTGTENMRLMARLAHLPRAEERVRGDRLLEAFDLVEASRRPVRTYSGGMRRRLDLALSLVGRPRVVFLDEPTTGLDPRSRGEVWEMVRAVVDAGACVLLTTQYLDEAERLADEVAVIDHGRVIARGTTDELKRTVGSAHVELVLADGSTQRVPTDGSVRDVRRILEDVERRALAVTSWQVREPTLDDVFLDLTGRPAAPAGPTDEPVHPRTAGADARRTTDNALTSTVQESR